MPIFLLFRGVAPVSNTIDITVACTSSEGQEQKMNESKLMNICKCQSGKVSYILS